MGMDFLQDDDELKNNPFAQLLAAQQSPIAPPASTQDYGNYLDKIAGPQSTPLSAPPAPAPVIPRKPAAESDPDNSVSDVVKQAIAMRAPGPNRQDITDAQNVQNQMNLNNNIGQAGSNSLILSRALKTLIPMPTPIWRSRLVNLCSLLNKTERMRSRMRQGIRTLFKVRFIRRFLLRTFGNQIKPEDIEGLTASDADTINKLIETKGNQDARKQQAQLMATYHDDQMTQKDDNRKQGQLLRTISHDPTITKAFTAAQNLDYAIKNVESTGMITPKDVNDLQAIAINNMGIGGGTSMHERASRYASSLGLKVADVEQFLTGNFQPVDKNNPLYSRYKQIMLMEGQNFYDRAEKHLRSLTAGYGSILKRNPDFQDDIDNTVKATLAQFPDSSRATPGVVPGQNPQIASYAANHGLSYEQAAAILNKRGLQK